MRLLVLMVIAVLAAFAVGAGQSVAAPGTTTTPPPSPGPTGQTPGLGIPILDGLLNMLAGGLGSTEGNGANGDSNQLIVVSAPKEADTTATLTAFERGSDKSWKPVIGPTKAFLGSLGMGEPKDNVYRTPKGNFALDQAFGRQVNPGTKMPYFKTDAQDWWDSNMKSPTYNTHVRSVNGPGGDSENLYKVGAMYDYAVNIAHNPQRTPGKASAIFLHVTDNQPTMGCVAIEREMMKKTLVWLDPAKKPRIVIGVNEKAPSGNSTTPAPGGDLLTGLLTQLMNLVPALLGAGAGSLN
ncbi:MULTISPECIES: L,D-transpeptidase [unclassified Gordonia (in: high G+C Gram-positive bacteria)]|uniref:L,D-transpeptidase family protein n=1 Tax=unclassified Gordonia (in: high G+C Gram-positive bacteria) TaxID=2657482 RepID=UPI001F11929C|nr:L,D-transpeptidase family protein [Gordonia sp. ABSL49_1]MCH5642114.1 L,D-transpeptidase family protein [Gordonia sp. ABSL49_1]